MSCQQGCDPHNNSAEVIAAIGGPRPCGATGGILFGGAEGVHRILKGTVPGSLQGLGQDSGRHPGAFQNPIRPEWLSRLAARQTGATARARAPPRSWTGVVQDSEPSGYQLPRMTTVEAPLASTSDANS